MAEVKIDDILKYYETEYTVVNIFDEIENKINRHAKLLRKRLNRHIWKFGIRR